MVHAEFRPVPEGAGGKIDLICLAGVLPGANRFVAVLCEEFTSTWRGSAPDSGGFPGS